MAGQDNVKKVESTISTLLKTFFHQNISSLFLKFMNDWWSGKFVLTKKDIVGKLTELALSPWIKTLSKCKVNKKSKLLREAITSFDLTLVKSDKNEIIANIWKGSNQRQKFFETARMYFHKAKNLSSEEKSKILWYLGEAPLVIEVNRTNWSQIKKALKFFKLDNKGKMIVLIGDFARDEFVDWNVLENLADLEQSNKNLFDTIAATYYVSLQKRKRMPLKDLPNCSLEILQLLKVKELLEMCHRSCINIGNIERKFPEAYIPRTFQVKSFEIKDILRNLRYIKKYVLLVNCHKDMELIFHATGAKVMILSPDVKHNLTNYEKLVLLSVDHHCSVDEFESMSQSHNDAYFFQMVEEDCFTLVMEKGYLFSTWIEPRLIKESETFKHIKSRMNVICAPPGMGKSTITQTLLKTCPRNLWCLHVKLIDCNEFLRKEANNDKILEHFMKLENSEEKSLHFQVMKVFLRLRKFCLLLDGLDELDSAHLDRIFNFVRDSLSKGMHVWVTSRENLKEKIVQEFHVVPVGVQEFTENDRKDYITKRLKSEYEDGEINDIIQAVFHSADVVNSEQLLGIPLQLYMITEIFLDDTKQYLNLSERNIFVLSIMFRIFFEGKKKFLHQKTGIKDEKQIGYNFNLRLKQYQIPALRTCLDRSAFDKLNIPEEECREFLREIREEGDKFGIIKQVNRDDVVFNHQTYAEYFASDWLRHNLDKVKLIKEEFFSEKNQNLKRMFDIMLSENSPLHLSIIYRDLDLFHQHFAEDKCIVNGIHILFLACSHCLPAPYDLTFNDLTKLRTENGFFTKILEKMLSTRKHLLETDRLFGMNIVEYSLRSQCLYPIELSLRNKWIDFNELKNYLETYYKYSDLTVYASLFGYPHLLEHIIDKISETEFEYSRYRIKNESYSFIELAIVGCDDCDTKKRNLETLTVFVKHVRNNVGIEKILKSGAPLTVACKVGCYESIKLMAPFSSFFGSDEKTIFHITAEHDTLTHDIAKWAIDNKVDINNSQKWAGETALHIACRTGHLNSFKILLENGAKLNILNKVGQNILHYLAFSSDPSIEILKLLSCPQMVNAVDNDGATPLHRACANGHLTLVNFFLKSGADVNKTDKSQKNTLHYACECYEDNSKIINLLVNKGVPVNGVTADRETALHFACQRHAYHNVEALLGRDADININTSNGDTLLHSAADNSRLIDGIDVRVIDLLIKLGLDINAQNNHQRTPLHIACMLSNESNKIDLVSVFLQNGADVNITDCNKKTALQLCLYSFSSSEQVLHLLLEKADDCINFQDDQGRTALHSAALRGSSLLLKKLLDKGADPNIIDNYGQNALHLASLRCDEKDVAKTNILIRGTNINTQDKRGKTVMHLAIEREKFDILKICLDHDCDVNIVDNDGMNLLHYLLTCNILIKEKLLEDQIKLLVENGIDINCRNKEGKTPLILAVQKYKRCVKQLVMLDADVNIADNHKMTCLHYYATRTLNNYEIEDIKLVINKDIHINAQDKDGKSPLHLAIQDHNDDFIKMMLNEKNINVTLADNDGNSVLHYILKHRGYNVDLITQLLGHDDIDINAQNKNGETALHIAFKSSTLEIIGMLLKEDADICALTKEDRNMLHYAVQNYRIQFWGSSNILKYYYIINIEVLYKWGFDINSQDLNGTSVLHVACMVGNAASIQLLLNLRVNVHVFNNKKQTILHYAALSKEPVGGLTKLGVDPYAVDIDGQTALDLAFYSQHYRALEVLVIEEYIKSFSFENPKVFYYCVYGGCSQAIRLLLKKEVDMSDLNCNDAEFPLYFLKIDGFFKTRLLLQMTDYIKKLAERWIFDNEVCYSPQNFVKYVEFRLNKGDDISSIFSNDQEYFWSPALTETKLSYRWEK